MCVLLYIERLCMCMSAWKTTNKVMLLCFYLSQHGYTLVTVQRWLTTKHRNVPKYRNIGHRPFYMNRPNSKVNVMSPSSTLLPLSLMWLLKLLLRMSGKNNSYICPHLETSIFASYYQTSFALGNNSQKCWFPGAELL